MKQTLRALAFAAALLPAIAGAQQYPTTFPANSVYGRIGLGSGPGSAIPISILQQYIYGTNVSQNYVWAGPASGGAGGSGFRALVAADLPTQAAITWNANFNIGSSYALIAAAHYGGTAANSQLLLGSTNNGSPSGDSVVLQQGGNNVLTVSNQDVFIAANNPGSNERGLTVYDANMAAGNQLLVALGQSDSTYNRAQIAFKYAGNASTSNFGWLGLYSQDQIITWWPNGNVGIGTGGSAPTAKLQVNGSFLATSLNFSNIFASSTAPSAVANGCAGSVGTTNGTAAFTISTGSGSCGSTITVTMPTAANGWICDARDQSVAGTAQIQQTGNTTTSVTFTNYSIGSSPAATNFSTSHTLLIKCAAY